MTITIEGIEMLTARPEKRLVKALNEATTRIAVLESQPTSRVAKNNLHRNQLIVQFTRQQDSLTSEVEHIVAQKIERKNLELFEVKEIFTNKNAVVKGYQDELADKAEKLTDSSTILRLAKKGSINLFSIPIEKYENGSKRIDELVEKHPWVAVLKMPGSKNSYHIATPTDFMTKIQKKAYRTDWNARIPEQREQRKLLISSVRKADAEYRRGAPERRKQDLLKRQEEKSAKRIMNAERATELEARKRALVSEKRAFNIRNKEALVRKKAMKETAKKQKKTAKMQAKMDNNI